MCQLFACDQGTGWTLFSFDFRFVALQVITETTGSVSGVSITSELNDELNDLIQRFHNQLHDSQVRSATPVLAASPLHIKPAMQEL